MILARLSLIAASLVVLTGASCTKPEQERIATLIFGEDVAAKTAIDPAPIAFAALTVEPESSEEVVTVELEAVAVVEPEPEPEVVVPPPEPSSEECPITVWRGILIDCRGFNVGVVE